VTITVLLVDDQPLIRMGFRLILNAADGIDVIGEADDGATGVQQAHALQPDVVLMDVRMPGMDGVEATRRICAAGLPSRVLILTTFDLDEYAFAGLQAGASGFVLKDIRPDELTAAIRAIAGGDAVVSPRITRELLNRTDLAELTEPQISPASNASAGALDELTPREREVLLEVAGGHTNAEIAQRLYLSEATVKTHITRILSKLGLRDRVQAVIFAYERGFRQP
jgi:DNA-binding NarL/FixJ family response regulator